MGDLLFPSTDRAVAVQVAVVVGLAICIGVLVRRERSLLLLTTGAAMVVLGFFGVRALH